MRVTVLLAPLPPKRMPETGSKVVLEEVAERVRDAAAVSMSPTVKAKAPVAVPEVMVWLDMDEIVGISFTELTVKVKLLWAVNPPPSVTVTLTVLVPD